MVNIRVRLKNRDAIRAKLRPQQGVKVDNQKLYLYDPSLIDDEVALARDWAIKTDGLVEEEDYSSKAWAIGGTGTETNNSKYYAGEASTSATNAAISETNASNSATSAGNSATTATTQAGIATTQAGIATTKAGEASTSATTATTQAGIATTKAGEASTSATNASNSATQAYNSATTAITQAGIATSKASEASTNATNSHTWAEGTDEQVQALGGTHSAKVWAQIGGVNDGQLDIQVNGTSIATFTANQSGNTTADVVVPDSATWGNITGTLSDQTDLQVALDDKQDKLTAGTDISIIGGSSSASVVSGVNTLNMPNAVANSLNYVRIYGKCEQTGTPTFDSPIDIICNNGAIKWDKVNNKFYADGTAEIITDSLSNTATAEMLLSLGDYVDNQEILTGAIIRNVGVKVLDGTESFNTGNLSNCYSLDVDLGTGNLTDRTVYCTHFRNSSTLPAANNRQGYALIGNKTTPSNSYTVGFGATTRFSTATLFKDWLAQQYANGTPIIIVYPLTVPTTETVTGQILTTKQGDNTISVSQSSISSLNLTASYMAEGDTTISFTNETGYITGINSTDVTTALGYTPYNSTNPNGYTSNVGTVTSVNNTSPDGSGNVSITVGDTLPSQTGQSGKFLTTDGTSTSWETPTASAAWGSITGTLSGQTDLQDALDAKQDEATAVNYDNITNCLTKIPQDIKLELSSGTLTLKAGSKVYVPNGFEQDGTTQKFDEITIENDISLSGSTSGTNTVRLLYYREGNVDIAVYAYHSSGTTPPASGSNRIFYNTSDNTIKRYTNGSVVETSYSLPIAIITEDDTYLCGSIDQVFNGFGYIGSTIFSLPNVKMLIPNGRNSDGTLKNISFETFRVRTSDLLDGNRTLVVQNGGGAFMGYLDTAYYEDKNIIKNSSGDIQPVCYIGHVIVESGAITRFETKSAFHAVDYSDSPTIAGWAMPNNQHIELTVGASGASYTAPANGWFCIKSSVNNKTSNYESGYETSYGGRGQINTHGYSNYGGAVVPVLKGQTVTFTYQSNTTNHSIKFVYAEGENV